MVAEGALGVCEHPGVSAVHPTFTAYVEMKPTKEVYNIHLYTHTEYVFILKIIYLRIHIYAHLYMSTSVYLFIYIYSIYIYSPLIYTSIYTMYTY